MTKLVKFCVYLPFPCVSRGKGQTCSSPSRWNVCWTSSMRVQGSPIAASPGRTLTDQWVPRQPREKKLAVYNEQIRKQNIFNLQRFPPFLLQISSNFPVGLLLFTGRIVRSGAPAAIFSVGVSACQLFVFLCGL